MRNLTFIILIAIIFPEIVPAQQIYKTRSGKASFTSNAPLEVIKAETEELSGAIKISDGSFAFSMDNKSFKGFNSALQQEHFYENYLETQQYPTSSFKGKIIETIDLNLTGEQVIRAKGILDIHGVAQERIIKGTVKVVNQKIQIQADFTVVLEDHQIKIPRVVYQKIAEVIDVSITAEMVPESK